MDSSESQTLLCWQCLPRDLVSHVLEFLGSNERALNGRLVSRDACRRLREPLLRTALFRLPLPQQAAMDPAWQPHLHRAFQQLTFLSNLTSLSAAAASGSERNLELSWALLQPCISLGFEGTPSAEDTATAAVRHGHLHLLPWLLQHGCLMNKHSVVLAAAEHCDLAGMQRVWELLGCSTHNLPSGGPDQLHHCLAAAAGRSGCDAVAKLDWLLACHRSLPRGGVGERTGAGVEEEEELLAAAAAGAATSGSLPVFRWLLQQHGQQLLRSALGRTTTVYGMNGMYDVTWWTHVMARALSDGNMAVVDWLVREVGPPVRPAKPPERAYLWESAAEGGNLQAMRWLQRCGLPAGRGAMEAAAACGQLEAVRFLHQECGLTLRTRAVFCAAAGSGSVPLATWLLQAGCPMSRDAYGSAAGAGHGAMVTWLAREARCPWGRETQRDVLHEFWSGTRDTSVGEGSSNDPQIEQAVWAMLDAGCPPGGGTDRADSIGAAAQLGYLDLVRHLRDERGVAFAPGTLAAAARGGCVPVVEWLVGAGCRAGAGADNDPYLAAVTTSCTADVATLSCMHRLGVPCHASVLLWAVDEGVSLRVLRWMVEQGAPWDEGVMLNLVVDCLMGGCAQNDETVVWFAERMGVRVSPLEDAARDGEEAP